MATHTKPIVHVVVDYQNLHRRAEELGKVLSITLLLKELRSRYKVPRKNVSVFMSAGFFAALRDSQKRKIVGSRVNVRRICRVRQKEEVDPIDVALLREAKQVMRECSAHVQGLVLVSSDGDFAELAGYASDHCLFFDVVCFDAPSSVYKWVARRVTPLRTRICVSATSTTLP